MGLSQTIQDNIPTIGSIAQLHLQSLFFLHKLAYSQAPEIRTAIFLWEEGIIQPP